MAIKTQGSQLYGVFPSATPGQYEVVEIEDISNFNAGGNPADQLVLEHLAKTSREYLKGMRSPAQATFTVDADPRNPSHVKLHQAAESDSEDFDDMQWVLGWSDGSAAPTVDEDGDLILPTARTWFKFSGYVSDFPFDFATNSVVKTSATIQRSGAGEWIKKA